MTDNKLHVWTDGDLNKLLYVAAHVINKEKEFHIILCQPNRGNKYKWDALIEGGTYEELEELSYDLISEFF